jgi:simple sugar transport system permease protein
MTQRMVGVPANMVNVLQGIIILVIVATKMVLADPYLMEKVWRKVQKRSSKSKEVEA